jgi:hypothetical protein
MQKTVTAYGAHFESRRARDQLLMNREAKATKHLDAKVAQDRK